MSETKKNCPICGKAGLPDFRKEEVVCPACNTDLKAYVLLSQLRSQRKKKRILNMLLFVIPCSLLIFSLCYLIKQRNTQKEAQTIITSLKEEITSLKEREIETIELAIPFEYTIRKGDSFYLISRRIYDTEKYAQDIANINQMDFTSKLTIGNKIKLPQK